MQCTTARVAEIDSGSLRAEYKCDFSVSESLRRHASNFVRQMNAVALGEKTYDRRRNGVAPAP